MRLRASNFLASALTLALATLPAAGAVAESPAPVDVPAAGGISASIPWTELRDLLRAAWAAEAGHAVAPSGPAYAFGPADVKARLGGGQIAATITVPVRTFREGATAVRLFDAAPAVSSASLDGGAAPLVVGDGSTDELVGGALYVIIPAKGEHHIVLEVLATAPEIPGPNATALPPFPSPATTLELVVDETLSGVELSGGVVIGATGKGVHTFRVALGAGTGLYVSYVAAAPPEDPVLPGEIATPRVTATVNAMMEVGDGVLRLRVSIDFAIARAPVTELKVALPEGYELVLCDGAGLRRCAADAPGVLVAELGYKVEKSYALQIVLERSASGEGASVVAWPSLRVLGVEHEIGFLAVVAESGIEVRPGASKGVLPIDVVELPAALQAMSSRPALLGFRYTRQPYELALAVTRHPSGEVLSSAIDSARITLIATEDGDSVARAVYRVRNNRKQFLVVTLPLGASIWNTFVAGEPVKPGESAPAADGRPIYLVPLARSVGGAAGLAEAFDVEVIYFREGEKFGLAGTIEEALPSVDLPVSEMSVVLYLPDAHDYVAAGGDLDTKFGDDGDGRNGGFFFARRYDGKALGGEAYEATLVADPAPAEDAARSAAAATAAPYLEAKEDLKVLGDLSKESRKAPGGGMTRGVLPVKFVLPERGHMVAFSTALVLPGESPEVYVRYVPSWVRTATLVLGIAGMTIGLLLVARAVAAARRRRALSGADTRLWVGIAAIILAAAAATASGTPVEPVALAGGLLAVGTATLRWFVEKARWPSFFRAAAAAASGEAAATAAPVTPSDEG